MAVSFLMQRQFMVCAAIVALTCALTTTAAQTTTAPTAPPQSTATTPQVEAWSDDFNGEQLDATKWEQFTFEGGIGKLKIENGELRQRGTSRSRAGVRSVKTFTSERFTVEAKLARVGAGLPESGDGGNPLGNAIVCLMFDSAGANRVEWLLTNQGRLEAWAIVNGRGERLDNNRLGTKEKSLTLGIARIGDDFLFTLNGQIGLRKTVRGLPRPFRVMLYGFSSAENNWDSVLVQTLKQ